MNIVSTQFNLENRALEIYLSGCYGNCNGCHNPELQDFDLGNLYTYELPNILNKIKDFSSLIESIWILGGEPLDQNIDELEHLIKILSMTNKNIWLWTRYELSDITDTIKIYCKYIKCGEYIGELRTDDNIQFGIQLASSNQKIYSMEDINESN